MYFLSNPTKQIRRAAGGATSDEDDGGPDDGDNHHFEWTTQASPTNIHLNAQVIRVYEELVRTLEESHLRLVPKDSSVLVAAPLRLMEPMATNMLVPPNMAKIELVLASINTDDAAYAEWASACTQQAGHTACATLPLMFIVRLRGRARAARDGGRD